MWPQAGVNGNLLTMTINEPLDYPVVNGELSYRYTYLWNQGYYCEFPNHIMVENIK